MKAPPTVKGFSSWSCLWMGLVAWIKARGWSQESTGQGHQWNLALLCARRLMGVFGWLFKDISTGGLCAGVMKGWCSALPRCRCRWRPRWRSCPISRTRRLPSQALTSAWVRGKWCFWQGPSCGKTMMKPHQCGPKAAPGGDLWSSKRWRATQTKIYLRCTNIKISTIQCSRKDDRISQ